MTEEAEQPAMLAQAPSKPDSAPSASARRVVFPVPLLLSAATGAVAASVIWLGLDIMNGTERDALKPRLAALEQRRSVSPEQLSAIEKTLSARLLKLEAALETTANSLAEARAASPADPAAIAALEKRIEAQEGKLDSLKAQPEASPALALLLLDRAGTALRKGIAFPDEKAALKKLPLDPAALQVLSVDLSPFWGTDTLKSEFDRLKPRILAQARPAPEGWGGQAFRLFERIVTIRAPDQADTPEGLSNRIDRALAQEQLREALGFWRSLPEPSRRISQEWGEALERRVGAENALDALNRQALQRVAAP